MIQMNNIMDSTAKNCTGCGACVTVCPSSAVDNMENEDGFYEASVITDKCVSCGRCKKVCLKFLSTEESGETMTNGRLFAVRATDNQTLTECTSGGVAYELAKDGFFNGYIVTGVVYNYDQHIAETIIATSMEDIEKFKGSKYLQSSTLPCYSQLIDLAKKDNSAKFMIFGTPCQITGIKKSFKVNGLDNEVLFVDLFCHGVPSYHVWRGYRQWLKQKHALSDFQNLSFRSKKVGWHDFTMEVSDGKTKYAKSSEYDLFYKAFFDNILLNKACQTCVVRKERTEADIRLGDFWGRRFQDDHKGVSAVLIMSEKGQEALNHLDEIGALTIITETPVDECLRSQSVKDYKNQSLNKEAITVLSRTNDLKRTIRYYRKHLPVKYRTKLVLKESTAFLPAKLRAKIRNLYRKSVSVK